MSSVRWEARREWWFIQGGDRIRFTGGSFVGIAGEVTEDQQIPEWVRVAFKIYGRDIQLEVEAHHLEKLE
jgi:transcription antitermination factor NusG